AALCFPLGEPLSAFSGRHSMTHRLVLNLLCHRHVYQGTWPGKAVREHVLSGFFYSHLLQMSRGYEDQHSLIISIFPGSFAGGRAAVFSALRQAFFAEQLQWNSTSTQRRSIHLAIRLI
ncbi:LOW QUALITY PROTEIN: hypothetical protein HID58_055373, partial [Brassica napus]